MADNTLRGLLVRLGRVRFSSDASLWSRSMTMAFMTGVLFGVFDVIVLGLAIVGGRYQSCSKTGHEVCDFYLLALMYPVGAAAMGAVLGALFPLCRRLWQAVLIGSAAMLPWFVAIALTDVKTLARWTEGDSWIVGVCSVLVGAPTGCAIWKKIGTQTSQGLP